MRPSYTAGEAEATEEFPFLIVAAGHLFFGFSPDQNCLDFGPHLEPHPMIATQCFTVLMRGTFPRLLFAF